MKVSNSDIHQKYKGISLKSTKISVTTDKQGFLNGRRAL